MFAMAKQTKIRSYRKSRFITFVSDLYSHFPSPFSSFTTFVITFDTKKEFDCFQIRELATTLDCKLFKVATHLLVKSRSDERHLDDSV